MKRYKVPIDFIVEATSPEECKVRINEFLLHSVMENRITFGVIDYHAPVGYPVEEMVGS